MDDLRNRVDDLGFADGHQVAYPVVMDGECAEWDPVEGASYPLTEANPKLLCELHDSNPACQIRAYLGRSGYKAKEWTPVHPHYSEYHQDYFWATPFQQGASALAGSRA